MGNVKSTERQNGRSLSAIEDRSATAAHGRTTGPPHYRQVDPTPYGTVKSSQAPPCKIKFINNSGVTLRVNWINFEGHRVLYAVLPGHGHCCKLSTFTLHPWILEKETGDVFAVYIGESAVVTIKGRNDFTVRKSTRPLIPWKQEANTIVQNGRSKLSSIRSSASAPCIVQFANRSEVPLKVNWLNFEGNKVLYTTLATGSMYHQRTFTAHPWVLEGESGDFYAIYVGASALVTVNGKNDFTVTHPSSQPLPQKYCPRMAEVLKSASSANTDGASSMHAHANITTPLLPHDADSRDCVHGCTICCELLVDNIWSLKCGHVFHGECIDDSCRHHMECPICRNAIDGVSDLRRIFLN